MNQQQYVGELLSFLPFISESQRAEIVEDINAHFDEAREAGLDDASIIEKLGPPKDLAEEFSPNSDKKDESIRGKHPEKAQEDYYQEWTENAWQGMELIVRGIGVRIECRGTDQQAVHIVFDGKRKASFRGVWPEIRVKRQDNALIVEEKWDTPMGFISAAFSGGKLEGLLTVSVPSAYIARLGADNSSGSLTLQNIGAHGDIIAKTVSGKNTVDTASAQNITVSASSGAVKACGLKAESLIVSAISGSIALDNAKASGGLWVNASSGGVLINGISAKKLSLSAVSGSVRLSDGQIQESGSIKTSSGAITLDKVYAASLQTETVSGKLGITSCDTTENLSGKTSSGAIMIANAKAKSLSTQQVSGGTNLQGLYLQGALSSKTSSGTLSMRDMQASEADLESVSGKVVIEQASCPAYRIKTSSGDITLDSLAVCSANISTISGSVRLALPKDAGFAFELKTISGRIRIGFPYSVHPEDANHKNKKALKGRVGNEDERIFAKTGSGGITIEPK